MAAGISAGRVVGTVLYCYCCSYEFHMNPICGILSYLNQILLYNWIPQIFFSCMHAHMKYELFTVYLLVRQASVYNLCVITVFFIMSEILQLFNIVNVWLQKIFCIIQSSIIPVQAKCWGTWKLAGKYIVHFRIIAKSIFLFWWLWKHAQCDWSKRSEAL